MHHGIGRERQQQQQQQLVTVTQLARHFWCTCMHIMRKMSGASSSMGNVQRLSVLTHSDLLPEELLTKTSFRHMMRMKSEQQQVQGTTPIDLEAV